MSLFTSPILAPILPSINDIRSFRYAISHSPGQDWLNFMTDQENSTDKACKLNKFCAASTETFPNQSRHFVDFVTGLSSSKNWRGHSYDLILVIVDRLTKISHYIAVNNALDAEQFAQVLIENLVRYHGLLDSIVTDRASLFTSQFLSSLTYFLRIRRRLSIAF